MKLLALLALVEEEKPREERSGVMVVKLEGFWNLFPGVQGEDGSSETKGWELLSEEDGSGMRWASTRSVFCPTWHLPLESK